MVLSPCLEDFVVVDVSMFPALAVVFSLAGLLAQIFRRQSSVVNEPFAL